MVQTLAANKTIKAHCNKLQRDFVVLVKQTRYDPSSKKFLTKYENVNVLVGPQADIDAVRKELQEFIDSFAGSFQSNFRVQAN